MQAWKTIHWLVENVVKSDSPVKQALLASECLAVACVTEKK